MKEYQYSSGSWQNVTDAIKEYFGWNVLTEAQSKRIMKFYLVGTSVEKIIEHLEEERNE